MKHVVPGLSSGAHLKKIAFITIALILLSFAASNVFAIITGEGHTLCVGETMQLYSSDNDGYWSSFDPTIATVTQNGLVTGISVGATPILYYSLSNGVSIYGIEVISQTPPPPPPYNTFTPKGNGLQRNAPQFYATQITTDDWNYAAQYEHNGRQNIVLDGCGSYTCADYVWGMAQNPGYKTSSTYGNAMLEDGSYIPGSKSNHDIICYDTNHWAIKLTEVMRLQELRSLEHVYLQDLYGIDPSEIDNLYISKWNANGPLVLHHLEDCPFYSPTNTYTYYRANW